MRDEMIEAVHVGHFGIEKTTGRARDIMFWPLMTKQISDHVQGCQICNRHKDSNMREPLHPHEVPELPWQNLGCDLFTWDGQEFMVLVDAYSRYFEIDLLPNTKSVTVIRKLKVHFSRFGSPMNLKTDNAAIFTCEQFQLFLKEWDIIHETSSPTFASSNGLSEVYVKIAKRLLQKAKESNTDIYMPLLQYRNTPLKCGYSPAQLLMSKRLRSNIPSTNNQLSPKLVKTSLVRKTMKNHKMKSKQYFDKSARKLPSLNVGESVRVQRGTLWEPATVIAPYNDHSYNIQTSNGATYRRNRRFINSTPLEHRPTDNDLKSDSNKTTPINTGQQSVIQQQTPIKNTHDPMSTKQISPKSVPNSQMTNVIKTRSGRVVKPCKLFSGEEWKK